VRAACCVGRRVPMPSSLVPLFCLVHVQDVDQSVAYSASHEEEQVVISRPTRHRSGCSAPGRTKGKP